MKGQNNPTILFFLFVVSINGCVRTSPIPENRLIQNLIIAGKNRGELEKVLTHYSKNPKDSLKYRAAEFLIGNMENHYDFSGEWPTRFDALFFDRVDKLNNDGIRRLRDSIETEIGKPDTKNIQVLQDLKYLSSSYIINNIDQAFLSWQNAPWYPLVSFDAFCNYFLPYKSSIEHAENWRLLLKERYQGILDDPVIPKTMEDICCAIIDEQRSWFHWTGRLGYYPGVLSISQILRAKKGSCNEMANLGAYAARALGIPVAFDYTPQYGNDNDAHKWNALMLSDSTSEHFQGGEDRPGDMALTGILEQKFAKVFRQQAGWVSSSFAARAMAKGITDIPPFLADPRIKDVTALYTPVTDIRLPIQGKEDKPVYLCVYKWRSWVAIAGGFIHNRSVVFHHMGLGLVYLPMYYSGAGYEVAGDPIRVDEHGHVTTIKPGTGSRKAMRLDRKYPFKRRWAHNMNNDMTGARFEGSNDPGFQNPVVLYCIQSPEPKYWPQLINKLEVKDRAGYDFCWNEVLVNPSAGFQYLRLVADRSKSFRVGEIEFYKKDNQQPLSGVPMGNVPEPNRAFDGFPGNSIKLRRDTSRIMWAGLNLGHQEMIDRIRYIPDPDRNAVTEGRTYELFYWDDKWVSAGIQHGKGLPLEYKEVPANGLYWLNCKDCDSDEERIFTYEDGKQVWW